MTFIQALRKARILIESGQEEFICLALWECQSHGQMTQDQCDEYVGRIQGILDRGAKTIHRGETYVCWVQRNHPKIAAKMKWDDFREGRLQWIDHMICEELRCA